MDACNSEAPLAFSPSAAQHNYRIVGYCRTSLAALAGVTAGILGLTGIIGFIFYFACKPVENGTSTSLVNSLSSPVLFLGKH
nr:hypothetical transcript [Hymenolepis microstoma]